MEIKNIVENVIGGRSKRGLEILQAALVLGVLGDSLLRAAPWGLNFFLWVTMLAVGLWVIAFRSGKEKLNLNSILLHGGLIFFAAMFVWRDSIQLMVTDVFAILAILAVLTLPALKLNMRQSGLAHYALGWVYSGFNIVFAPFLLLISDIKFSSVPRGQGTRHLAAALRGILVALPLLFIFGALFMAADAAYQELIEKTFHIDFALIINHFLLISFLSWITAGYLRGSTFSFFEKAEKDEPSTDNDPLKLDLSEKNTSAGEKKKTAWNLQDINNSFLPRYFTLGAVELSVALGLMNLLFLSFVIVQIPYLFGGLDLVQNTENLKLAEYARRGFGELVFVSFLVLPILLAAHWLIKKDDRVSHRIYQFLAGTQIALLFVIMLSAAQRMLLYTGSSGYGLTTLRFYPMVFMVWLAVVFVWFAVTVFRGRRDQFAWGTLWAALGFLAVLHVFNPDNFIARTNFALMRSGRSFDTKYIKELSDDAVPALLDEMPLLDPQQKCLVQKDLNKRLAQEENAADLRSWNWSRVNARYQLNAAIAGREVSGCEEEEEDTIGR